MSDLAPNTAVEMPLEGKLKKKKSFTKKVFSKSTYKPVTDMFKGGVSTAAASLSGSQRGSRRPSSVGGSGRGAKAAAAAVDHEDTAVSASFAPVEVLLEEKNDAPGKVSSDFNDTIAATDEVEVEVEKTKAETETEKDSGPIPIEATQPESQG